MLVTVFSFYAAILTLVVCLLTQLFLFLDQSKPIHVPGESFLQGSVNSHSPDSTFSIKVTLFFLPVTNVESRKYVKEKSQKTLKNKESHCTYKLEDFHVYCVFKFFHGV